MIEQGENLEDLEREINDFISYTIELLKPLNFTSQTGENEEIKIEKSFMNICNFMNETSQKDVSLMSVKEFYSLLAYNKQKAQRTRRPKNEQDYV